MRAVVPIRDMARRIPEAGRIRFGVKTGKAMKALDTFRFTSHDEEALTQIATLYGGTVAPWSDPKAAEGQHEVITEASEIRIVLPPDPLGGTPIYELWGGGGCERRCDGLNAEIVVKGQDGAEMSQVPCICTAANAMACEPRTRLSVILPEIRFGGVWRLETKSWNAAQEMPGMVDLIQTMQERGLTRGLLALKHRRSTVAGQTRRFVVPVLGVDETLNALASGAAQVGALGAAPQPLPELEAGEDASRPFDDVVVEAETMASADEHDILRQAVGFLDVDVRATFLAWWTEQGYPSVKDRDSLTARQYDEVMTHLERIDDPVTVPERAMAEARSALNGGAA